MDVGDRLVDLVEALLDVGRNHGDVADVDHVERLAQIDAQLEVVAAGSADIVRIACGPKRVPERKVVPASSGAPTKATSFAQFAHVLLKRSAQECPGRGVARARPVEEGDCAVADDLRRFADRTRGFLALAAPCTGCRDLGLPLQHPVP